MDKIFRLVGQIVIENDQAKAAVKETTQTAEQGSGGMVSAFKKIGSAVVTYLAVDRVIAFGKSCVESAAQVKAQTAQFEAAFGDLQGNAKKMFSSLSDETGVLATRLQTVGTGAFSQFKGAGLDAAEALKKTETYTNLAADAAAYYDMSLEEADSLMRSFIRGNTEAGDRLGLFTSESQRNSAAMEKLGKKYNQCTEAEKQMLMLDIVSEIYEQSGAMGQAAREADGYENVTGNLREAWRQFTAILGAPLLKAVIPIIQKMTTALTDAGDKVKKFGTFFKDNIGTLKPYWEKYGVPVMNAIKSMLTTLQNAWKTILPSLKNLWQSIWSGIKVFWNTIGKPVFDTIIWVVKQLYSMFQQYIPQLAKIVSSVFNLIAQFWNSTLKPVFTLIGTILKTVVLPVFKTVFNGARAVVEVAFKAIVSVWNNILRPVLSRIMEIIGNLATKWNSRFNALVTSTRNAINKVKSIVSNVKTIFSNVYNAIKSKLDKAKNYVKNIIDKIKGFFNFKVSLPKIKLPHFSISPKGWDIGDLLKGKIPKLSIDWYKKAMNNPMLLDKPSIFGYDPSTGNLMGGGEAGSEVVAGASKLMNMIRAAVRESNNTATLDKIYALLNAFFPMFAQMQMVLDSGALVGEIAPQMDEELGRIHDWKVKK